MKNRTKSQRCGLAAVMMAACFATISPGQNAPPGGGLARNTPYTLSGAYTLGGKTAKSNLATFNSDTKDVSAIYVKSGGDLTLTDPTITTTGDTSSDDNSSFYGLNAAVLDARGKIKMTGGTVTTSGSGANGVFATGSSATVTLTKVTITAKGDGAHGVMATAGGKLILDQVQITTAGGHAAAVATDRGGGTIVVTGGNFNTSGNTSPCIYSTGLIKVTGATMTATGAEAAVIEGKNSIILTDTNLTGTVGRGVMMYQSSSGDASGGSGTFAMKGGSLNASAGPLFYVTNTTATIFVTGVTFNASSGSLIDASAGQWGRAGYNGGNVTFTADNETLTGDLNADASSTITARLQNKTTLSGAAKNAGISLDASSIWTLTADSTVTTFSDQAMSGRQINNIASNGHNITYDSTLRANYSLQGRTYRLAGGGRLIPSKAATVNNNNDNNNGSNNPNQNQNQPGNTGNNGNTGGSGLRGPGGRR